MTNALYAANTKTQLLRYTATITLLSTTLYPALALSENYLGYYMIESRRHFKGFYEATEDEAKALGLAQRALSKAIKKALDCEHVYFFVLGDGVPHLHIHVIAKYHDAPREYWGPKVDEWPDAPRGGALTR